MDAWVIDAPKVHIYKELLTIHTLLTSKTYSCGPRQFDGIHAWQGKMTFETKLGSFNMKFKIFQELKTH